MNNNLTVQSRMNHPKAKHLLQTALFLNIIIIRRNGTPFAKKRDCYTIDDGIAASTLLATFLIPE